MGIHLQEHNHSFRFFLSAGATEKKEGKLHIFYTSNHPQWLPVIYPFLNSQKDLFQKWWHCTQGMASVMMDILQGHRFNGAAGLYYEAKALELLTVTIDRVSVNENADSTLKLTPYDIEMLEKAREILISDFENIPTIKQLARKVGTNDFKLKKGFRQHFGNSIFAYVQDVRLQNARKLLMETDHTITDIAYMTGYDYCNNFSVAFKRKFGVGAKEMRSAL